MRVQLARVKRGQSWLLRASEAGCSAASSAAISPIPKLTVRRFPSPAPQQTRPDDQPDLALTLNGPGRGSAFFTVLLKGARQGAKDLSGVIAGHQVAAVPEVRLATGKARRDLAGEGDRNLRVCSPCHRWTVVVTSSRRNPHGRLYRSRSAAMTVVPCR
jgi:hypothetical protein